MFRKTDDGDSELCVRHHLRATGCSVTASFHCSKGGGARKVATSDSGWGKGQTSYPSVRTFPVRAGDAGLGPGPALSTAMSLGFNLQKEWPQGEWGPVMYPACI